METPLQLGDSFPPFLGKQALIPLPIVSRYRKVISSGTDPAQIDGVIGCVTDIDRGGIGGAFVSIIYFVAGKIGQRSDAVRFGGRRLPSQSGI